MTWTLLQNFPEESKEEFIKECVDVNYYRVFFIVRSIMPLSILMTLASIWIKDTKSIQITNSILSVIAIILFVFTINHHPKKNVTSVHMKKWMTDVAYISMLLWSLSLLGFNPTNSIVFVDVIIVAFVVAFFYVATFQKTGIYLVLSLVYFYFATPYVREAHAYIPRLLTPILFFVMAFFISRIMYQQFMEKFILEEKLKVRQSELETELNDTNEKLLMTERNISKDIIKTLVKVLDYHDSYTSGHSENVAFYAKEISKEMGLSHEAQEELYVCGLLHDIGKILVPHEILNKPGLLSTVEFQVIRKHSEYGYEMLMESDHLHKVAKIVRHHHEFWDGTGYPDGLKKDEIPIESQILMVADTWDAMRSKRVYRHAKSYEDAVQSLIKSSGTQFSPNVIKAFIKVIDSQVR